MYPQVPIQVKALGKKFDSPSSSQTAVIKRKIRPQTANNRTRQPRLLAPESKGINLKKTMESKPEANAWVRPKDFDLFKMYSFIYKDQYANNLLTDKTTHFAA